MSVEIWSVPIKALPAIVIWNIGSLILNHSNLKNYSLRTEAES